MTRLPQWESRLAEWVEHNRTRSFEWGQFDCALMAASCAEAITGTHPAPDLIGTYYTALGAYRVILENDGLDGICDARLDGRVNPKRSRRGDIIMAQLDRKQCLGVDLGQSVLLIDERPVDVSKRGLNIIKAWRAG